eukprot:4120262-Alexandrium_andersonii.AAC.1
MEALEPGEVPPSSWDEYKLRVARKKRWIDGVGILAACEVLVRRVVILQWSWRHEQRRCTAAFEPRKTSEKKKAVTFPPI